MKNLLRMVMIGTLLFAGTQAELLQAETGREGWLRYAPLDGNG